MANRPRRGERPSHRTMAGGWDARVGTAQLRPATTATLSVLPLTPPPICAPRPPRPSCPKKHLSIAEARAGDPPTPTA